MEKFLPQTVGSATNENEGIALAKLSEMLKNNKIIPEELEAISKFSVEINSERLKDMVNIVRKKIRYSADTGNKVDLEIIQ